jgi:hypothetical protein
LLLEVMDASQSTAAAQVLAQAFTPTAPFFISLFDLDDRNLKTHGPADLDAVFDAVRGDAARP